MVTLTVNIAGSRRRFAAGDARRWIWKLYTAFWTLDFMIKMWAPNERQEDRVREPRWYRDWNTDFTTSESLRSKLTKGVCLLHNSLVLGLPMYQNIFTVGRLSWHWLLVPSSCLFCPFARPKALRRLSSASHGNESISRYYMVLCCPRASLGFAPSLRID